MNNKLKKKILIRTHLEKYRLKNILIFDYTFIRVHRKVQS